MLWVVAVAYFGFEVQLTLPAEPQWFYYEDDVVLITKSDGSCDGLREIHAENTVLINAVGKNGKCLQLMSISECCALC